MWIPIPGYPVLTVFNRKALLLSGLGCGCLQARALAEREREREIDRAREQTERHPGPEEWNEAKR